MPHIHTQPGEHDATVSAFIVRTDGHEPRIILHQHKRLHRLFQFGGHVELDETPWQAIAHEIEEESGYGLHQLQLLQPSDRIHSLAIATIHPQPICILTHQFHGLDHYHTDTVFAFVTDQDPAAAVGEGESGDIRLFTREELENVSNDEIVEDIKIIGLAILDDHVKNWVQVEAGKYER